MTVPPIVAVSKEGHVLTNWSILQNKIYATMRKFCSFVPEEITHLPLMQLESKVVPYTYIFRPPALNRTKVVYLGDVVIKEDAVFVNIIHNDLEEDLKETFVMPFQLITRIKIATLKSKQSDIERKINADLNIKKNKLRFSLSFTNRLLVYLDEDYTMKFEGFSICYSFSTRDHKQQLEKLLISFSKEAENFQLSLLETSGMMSRYEESLNQTRRTVRVAREYTENTSTLRVPRFESVQIIEEIDLTQSDGEDDEFPPLQQRKSKKNNQVQRQIQAPNQQQDHQPAATTQQQPALQPVVSMPNQATETTQPTEQNMFQQPAPHQVQQQPQHHQLQPQQFQNQQLHHQQILPQQQMIQPQQTDQPPLVQPPIQQQWLNQQQSQFQHQQPHQPIQNQSAAFLTAMATPQGRQLVPPAKTLFVSPPAQHSTFASGPGASAIVGPPNLSTIPHQPQHQGFYVSTPGTMPRELVTLGYPTMATTHTLMMGQQAPPIMTVQQQPQQQQQQQPSQK